MEDVLGTLVFRACLQAVSGTATAGTVCKMCRRLSVCFVVAGECVSTEAAAFKAFHFHLLKMPGLETFWMQERRSFGHLAAQPE